MCGVKSWGSVTLQHNISGMDDIVVAPLPQLTCLGSNECSNVTKTKRSLWYSNQGIACHLRLLH
jgi:hypothetical protein